MGSELGDWRMIASPQPLFALGLNARISQKVPNIVNCRLSGFLLGMRHVKHYHHTLEGDAYPSSTPLPHSFSQGLEQSFNDGPGNIASGGLLENSLQDATLLAVMTLHKAIFWRWKSWLD